MATEKIEALADELEDAYRLIECAVPLALRLIKEGKATLYEQRDFWNAVDLVDAQVDLLDEADDGDFTVAVPIGHRIVELARLARGE